MWSHGVEKIHVDYRFYVPIRHPNVIRLERSLTTLLRSDSLSWSKESDLFPVSDLRYVWSPRTKENLFP